MSKPASDKQINVRVGEDQVIIPLHTNPGPVVRMVKLGNGDIIVNTYWSLVPGKRSRDGGQTWEDATCMRTNDGGETWCEGNLDIGDGACLLPVGEAAMFFGWPGKEMPPVGPTLLSGDKELRDYVYTFPFRRWTEDGAKQFDEQATVTLPQRATRDRPERAPDTVELYPDHAMIQLRDGSLIATMQSNFPFDPPFPKGWRAFVVRSTDGGRTWNYLSTIATDFEAKHDDGFCEPDLVRIPNGDILCLMRTGGQVTGSTDPICLSVSHDDGLLWSEPRPITKFGVYPNAVLTESGVIALCYGRPGNWMAFSLDYGKTWINHIEINDAPESVDAGHYNCLVEVEPGKLLVGYAQGDPNVDSQNPADHVRSEIRGTFVYVERVDK